jgi:hypothetical protein
VKRPNMGEQGSRYTMGKHSFDELAKGLATGEVSRRKALRLMGAALVGGALASLPGTAWAAKPAGQQGCPIEGQVRVKGQCVFPCTPQSEGTDCGRSRFSTSCVCRIEAVTGQAFCGEGVILVCRLCNTTSDCPRGSRCLAGFGEAPVCVAECGTNPSSVCP